MAARTFRPGTYVIVCVALLCGTVLSTAVSFFPIQPVWHTVIGLVIAVCQAMLVVLFSMHLALTDKVHWSVFLVAVFWVGILFVLTFADYFTRELTPFAPGH